MNITRDAYEAAIKDALAVYAKANGGYLMSLEGYAGQFDRDETLQLWLGRLPSILINLDQGNFPERTNQFWKEELSVNLIIGVRSWRGQDESRGSSSTQIGLSKIFMDVRTVLLGKTLGLTTDSGAAAIRPLELVREVILDSDAGLVIGGAEYLIINDRVTEVA